MFFLEIALNNERKSCHNSRGTVSIKEKKMIFNAFPFNTLYKMLMLFENLFILSGSKF